MVELKVIEVADVKSTYSPLLERKTEPHDRLCLDASLNADNALLSRLHGFRPLTASDGCAASLWCQKKVQRSHYPGVALRKLIRINRFPCAMSKVFWGVFFVNR